MTTGDFIAGLRQFDGRHLRFAPEIRVAINFTLEDSELSMTHPLVGRWEWGVRCINHHGEEDVVMFRSEELARGFLAHMTIMRSLSCRT